LALVFLLTCLSWQVPAQPNEQSDIYEQKKLQSYRFASVQIPVWVANRRNLPLLDLKKRHFELRVDGRKVPVQTFQQAEDQPIELVYLLDISGSMAIGEKLEGSIQTISYLLKRHRPEDIWRVVVFSDGQILEVHNHKAAQTWEDVIPKVRAYGKTALFDALSIADRYFPADPTGSRAIVLFTDGNDNQSILSKEQLYKLLEILDVPVFIVGIADGFIPKSRPGEEKLGLQTLQEITTITGGIFWLAEDTSFLPEIGKALSRKMRPQYILTMTVERREGETRHRIDVRVRKRAAYHVRFRQGFMGALPNIYGGIE
jgi:VWFA-related protein